MVGKRASSPGLRSDERPLKRQMTSSPEEGEVEDAEAGELKIETSTMKLGGTSSGPPPAAVNAMAPPKFKMAFPFKKKQSTSGPSSSQPPVPPPPRSPSRSPPDSPPLKLHRLPAPRDDHRRALSPPGRRRGYVRGDYDYNHSSRRVYERRDRERDSYYPPLDSVGYDSYRPGYSDGRRPRSRSRSDSQSRSRSRRSRSPYTRRSRSWSRHSRSRSPRRPRSPRSTTPATRPPPSTIPNFSPPHAQAGPSPTTQTLSGFSPPTQSIPSKSAALLPPPSSSVLPSQRSQVKIAIAKELPPPTPAVPLSKQPPPATSPHKSAKFIPRRPPHALRSPSLDLKHYQHAFKGCSSLSAYSITTKVGEGTFGEVHKAAHKPTGQAVALKRILMHNEKEGMPITALREIRILKKLKHPNIVGLMEVVVEVLSGKDKDKDKDGTKVLGAGRAFHMVFPYMDHDLAGLLENERVQMTPSQIKLYMKQLLEGTAYLHANNIIHRDMKAANLLISNDGLLQIADFGLARPFDPNLVSQGRRNGEGYLPKYTNCVVTRWYRPPELFLGARRYGGEIDIWGIGCVLGEMFTRRPLLMGSSDVNQLDLIWQLCGTPSGDNWPGYDDLPGLDGVKRWKMYKRLVRSRFQNIGAETVDLLDKLLTLDPARRITAVAALDHDWFWTDPLPANPKSLPKYESSHEIDKRTRKNYQQPPRPITPVPLPVPQHGGAPSNPQGKGHKILPQPMSNPMYRMGGRYGHGHGVQHQNQPEQHGGAPGFPSYGGPPGPAPPYGYPPPGPGPYGYPPGPGPGVGPPGWRPTGSPPPGWLPGPPGVPFGYSHPPGPYPHPSHAHHHHSGYRPRGGGGREREVVGSGGFRDKDREKDHRKSTLGPPPGTNGLPPKPAGNSAPSPQKKGIGGQNLSGNGALPYD